MEKIIFRSKTGKPYDDFKGKYSTVEDKKWGVLSVDQRLLCIPILSLLKLDDTFYINPSKIIPYFPPLLL
jgi:hypothetical protein